MKTISSFDDSSILDKIDIGSWSTYQSFSDKEQLRIQRENLTVTHLNNGYSDIKFIYTKEIARLNELVTELASEVRIVDTTTSLEDEIFYTTKIEGAKTTRLRTTEIHNGAKIIAYDFSECMVRNCFNAVKLLNIYGNQISHDKIINVWKVLVNGCCENEQCRGDRYRIGDVTIGSFSPIISGEVEKAMETFINFYNSTEFDNYPFIKAALLHFAFETIHPFCDGNGRMGRLIINNYLISRGIESAKAVSFSMFIDKARIEYDVAFVQSENIYFDCTPFVLFMLQRFYEAYEMASNINN